jgi:hypothetical protein
MGLVYYGLMTAFYIGSLMVLTIRNEKTNGEGEEKIAIRENVLLCKQRSATTFR